MREELQNYQNKSSRLIRSYGRIKSRRLSDHKNLLLTNFLPQHEIDMARIITVGQDWNFLDMFMSRNDSAKDLQESPSHIAKCAKEKISFEIGFGFGDFIFAKAQANPNQMFLGCEPHVNGVVNLLAKIEKEPLDNIKISRNDAREMLQKFPDNFFDEIYILFPDPWPKVKHFKRRLINVEFLDEIIAAKLKKGAKLIIATDHDSYKTWILSSLLKSRKLAWEAASKHDWQKFPADWIETKYQKKAANEGRVSVIFNLRKI